MIADSMPYVHSWPSTRHCFLGTLSSESFMFVMVLEVHGRSQKQVPIVMAMDFRKTNLAIL